MGQVITFYSFKGGVGRTMALANVAVELCRWDYKVLVIDWDLEAPGLEFFFKDYLNLKRISDRDGVIDILSKSILDTDHLSSDSTLWSKAVSKVEIPKSAGNLHLITAGKKDDKYFEKVRSFDIGSFYESKGGFFIERLRNEWKEVYDYILIDSRTGITDIGGICTIQLPDTLLLLFTATEQSLRGTIDVSNKAIAARKKLPFDRLSLLSVPIPSRFETGVEHLIAQEWLDRFSTDLSDLYANWLPSTVNRRDFLVTTKIPYVPYFSFGERLPIIDDNVSDPAGLGFAIQNLAALIANNFEDADQLLTNRNGYVSRSFKGARREESPAKHPQERIDSQTKSKPYVFLSYAHQDRERVERLYRSISEAGFRPWMDSADILPGERWEPSLRRAIQRSSIFLAFLSTKSVTKQGLLASDLKQKIERINNKSSESVYLVPVCLDSVKVPEPLHQYQRVNLFESDGWSRLVKAMQVGAERQVAERAIIFTSLRSEYEAIRDNLTEVIEETLPQGTVYEVGSFSSVERLWQVSVFEIGGSNIGSALETARAIQYINPSVVLSVGVAAGVRNVSIGDVVAGTKIYGFESSVLPSAFNSVSSFRASSFRMEQRARAEARKKGWLKAIRLRPTDPLPKVHVAPIAAGDKVITSKNSVYKFLRSHYSDVLAVEMEGRRVLDAIYADQNIDALVIRGISDLLNSKVKGRISDIKKAARHASAFAFEVLQKLETRDMPETPPL